MIDVVGVAGAELTASGHAAVRDADVLCGGDRLLSGRAGPTIRLDRGVDAALDAIADAVARGHRVCVLASGDPGWFGIVRALSTRFGSDALHVHPAVSSVSMAFARLGLPWDDATVVSAHGRPLAEASRLAARCPKVAVLTAPDAPPEAIGRSLIALGAAHTSAAVCGRLGLPDELVKVTDLPGLAAGAWEPLSVVVLWTGTGVAPVKSIGFGLAESAFAHRAGMITKSEIRAAVIGRLALPPPANPAPVLWDVGAGSGSVAVECAALAPWLDVIAIDDDPAAVQAIRANAASHQTAVRIESGAAPASFEHLPDPDRVFVGGGGLAVLEAAVRRVVPGGTVVATFAALDRAAVAADLLGNVVQITANRGRRLPDGGWRLEATNPVFVAWGTPCPS